LKSGSLGSRSRACHLGVVPKGPQGQKRPADVIGNAVHVMQIATGLITERVLEPAKQLAREGGLIGGPKRAAKLSKKRRTEIASKAAKARWKRK
jgi:hypothetical protein